VVLVEEALLLDAWGEAARAARAHSIAGKALGLEGEAAVRGVAERQVEHLPQRRAWLNDGTRDLMMLQQDFACLNTMDWKVASENPPLLPNQGTELFLLVSQLALQQPPL
jgi:hypothetical protein